MSFQLPASLARDLEGALGEYLLLRTDANLAEVRFALDAVSNEAHRCGLGPEKVVIALKHAWTALPAVRRAEQGDERIQGVFERLLAAALEAYFRPFTSSANGDMDTALRTA